MGKASEGEVMGLFHHQCSACRARLDSDLLDEFYENETPLEDMVCNACETNPLTQRLLEAKSQVLKLRKENQDLKFQHLNAKSIEDMDKFLKDFDMLRYLTRPDISNYREYCKHQVLLANIVDKAKEYLKAPSKVELTTNLGIAVLELSSFCNWPVKPYLTKYQNRKYSQEK